MSAKFSENKFLKWDGEKFILKDPIARGEGIIVSCDGGTTWTEMKIKEKCSNCDKPVDIPVFDEDGTVYCSGTCWLAAQKNPPAPKQAEAG